MGAFIDPCRSPGFLYGKPGEGSGTRPGCEHRGVHFGEGGREKLHYPVANISGNSEHLVAWEKEESSDVKEHLDEPLFFSYGRKGRL